MSEYTITMDYSMAHVLADGLARLSAEGDADRRAAVYKGVFPDGHELRDPDGYCAVLERAARAVDELLAVSDATTAITVTVAEE